MAVRFLPHDDDASASRAPEREALAEVIDLRARLPQVIEEERAPHTPFEAEPQHETSPAEPAEPANDANGDAVQLLARKALSSGELERELLKRGHPTHDVLDALAYCDDSLYLDDLGLARTITENLRERKRASRAQIRIKLRERLLADHAIEEALGELDDDEEHDLLVTAATDRARKLSGLDRTVAERRLLGFLARRGWNGEAATRACRTALDEAGITGAGRGSARSGVSFS